VSAHPFDSGEAENLNYLTRRSTMPKSAGTSVPIEINSGYPEATYSPADRKLRFFTPAPDLDISEKVFHHLTKAGFRWDNKRYVFVAPFQRSAVELLIKLCGKIGDERLA
jgi:hypothetical protein